LTSRSTTQGYSDTSAFTVREQTTSPTPTIDTTLNQVVGSEDRPYLNIWAPAGGLAVAGTMATFAPTTSAARR